MIKYKQIINGLNVRPEIGFFGYSSVTLIEDGNENILVDTGSYGIREYLANFIKQVHIHKVFISHLHFDHCANINLFKDIPIYIHKDEIASLKKDDNDIFGDLYQFISESLDKLKVIPFSAEDHLSENTRIKFTPGHTIGHSSLEINDQSKRIIVAGDAIETLQEYRNPNYEDEHFDKVQYKKSYELIKNNYNIIIPGHDYIIEDGKRVGTPTQLKTF